VTKLLAVLKDSFREAIDAKVFYAMMALSTMLIIVVGGLSFKPDSPQKMMQLMCDMSLNGDFIALLQGRTDINKATSIALYDIKSVEPIDSSKSVSRSDYRVLLRARYADKDEHKRVAEDPDILLKVVREKFGAMAGDEYRVYDVSDLRLATPAEPPAGAPAVHEHLVEFVARPTPAAHRVWPHQVSVFYGAWSLGEAASVPIGAEIYLIEDKLVNGLGAWVAILISVIISALFIPNMLRKGTIDLLLVKPMSRVTLLVYKYLGGLIFIFLNTAFAVIGVWFVLGLRSGIWATGFLLSIFVITFFFAILYAVSTLFGVLTRSAIVSILATCFAWFMLWGIGNAYLVVEQFKAGQELAKVDPADRIGDRWWYHSIKFLHFIVPRTSDLDHLSERFLIRDLLNAQQIKEQKLDPVPINWTETIAVSLGFIVVMLALSCWRFSARDY
jgi:ABC-type transport system involved in multi-copper enzyme maturation permease subunit